MKRERLEKKSALMKGESSSVRGKEKVVEEQNQHQDNLLGGFGGYNVCSSDMADVEQQLKHLEMVMQEDTIPNLATDTAHYDPTDPFGWAQSILYNEPSQNATAANALVQSPLIADSGNELLSIPLPYLDACPPMEIPNPYKRFKSASPTPITSISSENALPAVQVEEAGVQLVHALMACAEAVQFEKATLAEALVTHAGTLATTQGGSMGKVASFFLQALNRRIYGFHPHETLDSAYSDTLHMRFYESSPYLKFAHFTANHAILDASGQAETIHVIDFGLNQGLQWPALIQALAVRQGGPPAFRLTGIGPLRLDDTEPDSLSQVGVNLSELARKVKVNFEFRGIVCNNLADLEPDVFEIRPGESVVVNSIFELHPLLARPGEIEKVLATIKSIKPELVTVVEQEANHNGSGFLNRFTEALYYYASVFDSLEETVVPAAVASEEAEVYLGRQICNIVACEGEKRVERHETLDQWRARFGSVGFEPVQLGSNAVRQARMLLELYANREGGYRVEENNGCLMLGWRTRPLIATSAWKLA